MTNLPPLFAATRGDVALARADQTFPAASAATLLQEVRTLDDRVQDSMANRARSDLRDQARTAVQTARLENMQAGLRRLMGGAYTGPTVVAVTSDTGGRSAVAAQGAVVENLGTGDGADAVTIRANWVGGVHLDDDGGNFGPTRFFDNADALAIAARHVDGVSTGGGADAIAIAAGTVQNVMAGAGDDRVAIAAVVASEIYGGDGADEISVSAVTGLARNMEPETAVGRAMVALWAEGSATGRMQRAMYAGGVDAGDGADRIAVSVADPMAIRGGAGDDRISAAGGSFALHFAAGDGNDVVQLSAGAEAVVVLDPSLTDGYQVERGADSLTLRFGAGQSITFQGLTGAGAIGVSRYNAASVTLLHQPPGLDKAV